MNDFLEFAYGKEMGKIPKLGTGRQWKNLFPYFRNGNQNPSREYPRSGTRVERKNKKNMMILKILDVRRGFGPKFPQYPKTDSLTFWLNTSSIEII